MCLSLQYHVFKITNLLSHVYYQILIFTPATFAFLSRACTFLLLSQPVLSEVHPSPQLSLSCSSPFSLYVTFGVAVNNDPSLQQKCEWLLIEERRGK